MTVVYKDRGRGKNIFFSRYKPTETEKCGVGKTIVLLNIS